jgi:hypothetical protein
MSYKMSLCNTQQRRLPKSAEGYRNEESTKKSRVFPMSPVPATLDQKLNFKDYILLHREIVRKEPNNRSSRQSTDFCLYN